MVEIYSEGWVAVLTEQDKRDLAGVFKKGRRSLVNYRHLLLVNDPDLEVGSAPFQHEWSNILLNDDQNFAIQAFRESAKSQYVLRTFCLHALTFPVPQRDYMVIIKKNTKLARSKLREIENEYLSNNVISGNLIKVNEQSGEVFDLDVYDQDGKVVNLRIECYGKGASIRGLAHKDRRPKIVILDDPQDLEEALSETVQENDWTWFLSDVMFLGKNTRIFIIGNNLGEKCVIERIFANKDELRFKTMKIRVMTDDGKSAWPAAQTIEDIEQEKESFRKLGKLDVWYREKMCEAISDETRTFRREDFKYYGPLRKGEDFAKRCNVFIRTDLAISENRRADHCSIIVVGIDEENNWFLLDVVDGQFDPTTFINLVFETVVRWRTAGGKPVMNVGFPKVAYEAALKHFVEKDMPKRNVFFNVIEQVQEIQKELRIKALQPRYRAHTVYHPDSAPWLTDFEAQLLMFPKGLRDDMIDAMASVEQESQAPVSSMSSKNLPRYAVTD